MSIRTVVIGARGHTGSELLPLLSRHPQCRLEAVASSSAAGEPIGEHIAGMAHSALRFSAIRPDNLGKFPADLFVLALPNGQAATYVAAIETAHPQAAILDLSADHRFDPQWTYGQPERFAARLAGSRRIANPGCYATGMQLALAPLVSRLAATPVVFGISGYSGAGLTPSRRNDPAVLKENILPYSLAGHVHEREASHHLQRGVRFLPHVASFFRGISLTIAVELAEAMSAAALEQHFRAGYRDCPLVSVTAAIPEIAHVRGRHGVIIGGFTISETSPRCVSLVCVLDNLLKGAATQVIQNINLAFGLPSLAGLEAELPTSGNGSHE